VELERNKAHNLRRFILVSYEQYFSKYASNVTVPRIRILWIGIPVSLMKRFCNLSMGALKRPLLHRSTDLY